jgi:hypothetical protein
VRRAALLLAAAVWLGATGSRPAVAGKLPEAARGSAFGISSTELAGRDLVGYRRLVPGDFRASAPPAAARAEAEQLGAASCTLLVPDPLRMTATPRKHGAGWVYDARPDRLRFRAVFDRGCSWWNRAAPLPSDYVLQHEQIHFALTEIRARRLNAREPALRARVTASAPTAQAAIEASRRAVEALLAEETRAHLARSDRFDADTSGHVDRAAQGRWAALVERELAELAANAAPAGDARR